MHGPLNSQKSVPFRSKPVTVFREKAWRGKSVVRNDSEQQNVSILRNLLQKLNVKALTNKPSAKHRVNSLQPASAYSQKIKQPSTRANRHSDRPKVPPSDCLKDVNMEKALIDYSDIKNSFYLDKRENAKYVKRNTLLQSNEWSVRQTDNNTAVELSTTHDGSPMGERLELVERINKLLFYKNKQCEKKILQLQRLVQNTPATCPNVLSPIDQLPEINESEKLLLAQIEQQDQKIQELQNQLNSKMKATVETNEHVTFLQKRVEELTVDSKRYFEKYRNARADYVKLMTSLTNEKIYGVKQAREAMSTLNQYQKSRQTEDDGERKMYEKRVAEIEKAAQEFVGKRQECQQKISELEGKLKEKQTQDDKIEAYVNKLLKSHKEMKSDFVEVLRLCKDGKTVPMEYYNKYISQ